MGKIQAIELAYVSLSEGTLQRENHGLLAIAFYVVENKLANLSNNLSATIYNNEIALRRLLEV